MKESMKNGMREIDIGVEGHDGGIQVVETDDGAFVYTGCGDVRLDSAQLRYLGDKIVGWFDNGDDREALRRKLTSVLEQNEARCLDDDIDRSVVLNELMKALRP